MPTKIVIHEAIMVNIPAAVGKPDCFFVGVNNGGGELAINPNFKGLEQYGQKRASSSRTFLPQLEQYKLIALLDKDV